MVPFLVLKCDGNKIKLMIAKTEHYAWESLGRIIKNSVDLHYIRYVHIYVYNLIGDLVFYAPFYGQRK